MEVWKIVFHSILEIFHSIPFWHFLYTIPKFPFHSIFLSISFHGCRFCITIIIVTFYPNGCSQFGNSELLILKKLLPLSATFQNFRFRVCFRFQPLSSKCFWFHKKINSYHRFHFHIPDTSTITTRKSNQEKEVAAQQDRERCCKDEANPSVLILT